MKIFITLVIIFLVLRWLLKPFLRFTIQSTVNSMASEAMRRQQEYQRQQQQKKEGSISVDYIPNQAKRPPSGGSYKGGDYIDYEEIN